MVKEMRFGGQGKIKNKVMCYINIASEIPVQATANKKEWENNYGKQKNEKIKLCTCNGSLNKTKSGAYNKYAAYNAYYYLKARFGASADGNHLTVVGRYTP